MKNEKPFQIRVPKDIWVFLKKNSVDLEKSMNSIIIERLKKYKKSYEKKVDNI